MSAKDDWQSDGIRISKFEMHMESTSRHAKLGIPISNRLAAAKSPGHGTMNCGFRDGNGEHFAHPNSFALLDEATYSDGRSGGLRAVVLRQPSDRQT